MDALTRELVRPSPYWRSLNPRILASIPTELAEAVRRNEAARESVRNRQANVRANDLRCKRVSK